MNRILAILNLLGVLIVAAICGVQWNTNSRLEHQVQSLQKTSADQAAKIDDQAQTIKDDAADISDFHDRLSLAESQLIDTKDKLAQRVAEVNLLQNNLKKWMQAVADRDAALKQAAAQIQSLAAQRNDAIQKFNDLAGKYNALVKGQ
jgi:chromosome segregation ATPase